MKRLLLQTLICTAVLFASANGKSVTLIQNGNFAQYSHFGFFIDSDNNPKTGYSNWKIKGADLYLQENGLYRYPKGASGWKWEKIDPNMTLTHTKTSMKAAISVDLLSAERINYNAFVATRDWKKSKVLDKRSVSIPSSSNHYDYKFKIEGMLLEGLGRVALFIDADHNPNSGYSKGDIKGADILVENKAIYIRKNPDHGRWSDWQRVGKSWYNQPYDYTEMFVYFNKDTLHGITIDDQSTFQAFLYNKDYTSKKSLYVTLEQGIASVKTLPIVVIGPSTVYIAHANHEAVKADGVTDCRLEGWGERLFEYATDKDAVYNYARPGSNHNSFQMSPDAYVAFLIEEGQIRTDTPAHQKNDETLIRNLFGPNFDHYWERTKEKMQTLQKGILLIQFGGSNEDRISGNEHRFKENLRLYIEEARDLNFTPVFVTDIEKRIRNADGSLVKSRGEFPKWMKEVAKEEGVRVLDLNAKSYAEYSKLSDAQWDAQFGDCYGRWNGRKQDTHFEPKGAKVVAGWIRDLACEEKESKLCKALSGTPESFYVK